MAEERRGAAVGILEPLEQLRGEHKSVETILIVQREEGKVILGVKD